MHEYQFDEGVVERLIERWRDGGGYGVSLHEWLGMTPEEYGHWLKTTELP